MVNGFSLPSFCTEKSMTYRIQQRLWKGAEDVKLDRKMGPATLSTNYTGFVWIYTRSCQYIGFETQFYHSGCLQFHDTDFTKLMGVAEMKMQMQPVLYLPWVGPSSKGRFTYCRRTRTFYAKLFREGYIQVPFLPPKLTPPTFGQLQPPGQCTGYLVPWCWNKKNLAAQRRMPSKPAAAASGITHPNELITNVHSCRFWRCRSWSNWR